ELGGDAARLLQLEVGGCGAARRDVGGRRAIEVVADRADAQRIVAGLELCGREAVVALCVADDRDRGGGAVAACPDRHAFHRAFLGRRHRTSQRGLRAALGGRDDERERRSREQGQCGHAHQQFLPCEIPFLGGGATAAAGFSFLPE